MQIIGERFNLNLVRFELRLKDKRNGDEATEYAIVQMGDYDEAIEKARRLYEELGYEVIDVRYIENKEYDFNTVDVFNGKGLTKIKSQNIEPEKTREEKHDEDAESTNAVLEALLDELEGKA